MTAKATAKDARPWVAVCTRCHSARLSDPDGLMSHPCPRCDCPEFSVAEPAAEPCAVVVSRTKLARLIDGYGRGTTLNRRWLAWLRWLDARLPEHSELRPPAGLIRDAREFEAGVRDGSILYGPDWEDRPGDDSPGDDKP